MTGFAHFTLPAGTVEAAWVRGHFGGCGIARTRCAGGYDDGNDGNDSGEVAVMNLCDLLVGL